MNFDPKLYSSAVQTILGDGGRAMPLAPESALEGAALSALRAMSVEDLFSGESIASSSDAECVRSGLYLYLSALDESHTISQAISTASGSFWHGIMHRQEPDYSNAKYWFRRVGDHPVYADMSRETGDAWDAVAFVDRCEAAAEGGSGEVETVIRLQQIEWRLLFDHCYGRAVGR